MSIQPAGAGGAVERGGEGTLSDVITTILDKGLVIDVYARVSLIGIELLRADVRVVVASVDTYLRFAEATNRLELSTSEPAGLPELMDDVQESGSKSKTKGALEAGAEKIDELFGTAEEEEEEEEEEEKKERVPRRSRREEKESR
jgi:gas vesicle structural protein